MEEARSEEDLIAITDSFWDIGNYKRVVRRVDDGAKLCSEYMKMIHERAEIESKYAKRLQEWAKKWEELIAKNSEYGTLETGWKSQLKEAQKIAECHLDCQRRIEDQVIPSVNSWKGENYHKSLLHWKETRKSEENFQKAQKPWEKKLIKVRKAKKVYHAAAKELDSQERNVNAVQNSQDSTYEQCQRARDKRDKSQGEVEKTKAKYEHKLADLKQYQPKYIEDMTVEFDRCQQFEKRRMEFFKSTIFSYMQAIDLTVEPRIPEAYREFTETISRIDAEQDLKYYAETSGAGMGYTWPDFEEYIPGTSYVHKVSSRSNTPMADGSPPLSGSKFNHSGGGDSENSSVHVSEGGRDSPANRHTSPNNDEWPVPPNESVDDVDNDPMYASVIPKNRRKFEETTEEGTPMKAVYEFVGEDDDDLSFKEGDIVHIIKQCEDGWAQGIMNGKLGYVPYAYFEDIKK